VLSTVHNKTIATAKREQQDKPEMQWLRHRKNENNFYFWAKVTSRPKTSHFTVPGK